MNDPYSRLRLAGYEPERLHECRVLIAGAGSLAQPLAETLVLSGVGDLAIVDLDRFLPHNRAKSSHYPHHLRDADDSALPFKAEWVARSLAVQATAPGAVVRYFNGWAQALGTALVREVDLVVSCVDAVPARGWLARTALEHGRPLVTGGFAANDLWYSVYPAAGPAAERPCWNCRGTRATDAFSCRHYAAAAAADGIVPAIQAGAAALSGFMAEAAIMALHGRETAARSAMLDLRTGRSMVGVPKPDPVCSTHHRDVAVDRETDVDPRTATLGDLAAAIDLPVVAAALPFPLVHTAACRSCTRTVTVEAPLFAWEAQPQCEDHGGPWTKAAEAGLWMPPVTTADVRPRDRLWNVPMRELGVALGETLTLRIPDGPLVVRLGGSAIDAMVIAGDPRA